MQKLDKQLNTLSLFSIASGAMISSGLFVLPAIAYAKTGPMMVLCYLVASFLIVPAMFAKAELSTAMPKSGGTYFYVNRSLGPLLGTFAGFSNWLSLALKSAFALIGIGVFIEPFITATLPESLAYLSPWIIKGIAVIFCIIFTLVNLCNVKDSSKVQNLLVVFLLGSLFLFIIWGSFNFKVDKIRFDYPEELTPSSFFSTVGLIFISYGGLTKIASVAAEVKNPGKTIPKSMFWAFAVVSFIYVASVGLVVGILPHNQLLTTLTPLSDAAKVFSGNWGWWILALSASTAFITTANAGILAASRNPFAMAEDKLIPAFFGKVSGKNKVPVNAILFTSLFMLLSILFLDTEKLASVASAMMLLLYALDCISLIVMRKSEIATYKPQFRAPLFPYLQIAGIFIYIMLIIGMGWLPTAITSAFLLLSVIWYLFYSRKKERPETALIHWVEKVTKKDWSNKETSPLTDELREILFERDELKQDRFDKLIEMAHIIDLDQEHPEITNRKQLFTLIGKVIEKDLTLNCEETIQLFEQREAESTTNLSEGLAIPHILFEGQKEFSIVILRSVKGIEYREGQPPVHIVFALAGSKDERNFYLKCLMSIAQIISDENFKRSCFKVKTKEEFRNIIRITKRTR